MNANHEVKINQTEPDPDAIKMFVGQIPRHYEEEDLRTYFSKYGSVYNVTVLRDKQTGKSKGRKAIFTNYFENVPGNKFISFRMPIFNVDNKHLFANKNVKPADGNKHLQKCETCRWQQTFVCQQKCETCRWQQTFVCKQKCETCRWKKISAFTHI
jgi:hypothetical protein